MATRFATINLYNFAEPPASWYDSENQYSPEQWQSKTQWLSDQLCTMNADVVGFQEVFSIDALKNLVKIAGYDHFATIEEPFVIDVDKQVMKNPVVAVSSKHPIVNVQAVAENPAIVAQLPIQNDFIFSRKPIKATIDIPTLGQTIVYVAHLKSKRPAMPKLNFNDTHTATDKVFTTAQGNSVGEIASMIQRGVEATMIYHDATFELAANTNLPLLVMGDMNDNEESDILDALSNQFAHLRVEGRSRHEWSEEEKVAHYQSKLYDAWHLITHQNTKVRLPTHIFGAQTSVLDYIFVSNALNAKNPNHVAKPSKYKVYNNHIFADGVGDQLQSDHGLVMLEVE